MRKFLLLLILLITASGCSYSINIGDWSKKSGKEKAELTLQVTKVDEDAGVTIENNEMYQEINKRIAADPLQGADNDFSLYVLDILETNTDELRLLFIGINRLPTTIRDMRFDFTLGNKDGEYVWEELPLDFPESEFGAIKSNNAFPVFITITEEQAELVKRLTEENQVFKMDNFNYDSVK